MSQSSFIFRGAKVWQNEQLSEKQDLFVNNGIISEKASPNAIEIDLKGSAILPGLTELSANFPDPSSEDYYTVEDGARAMLRGGFVRAVVEPLSEPICDCVPVWYSRNQRAQKQMVELLMASSLTQNLNEGTLAELFLLKKAGALVFSDGDVAIQNGRFLRNLMKWCSASGIRPHLLPLDNSIAADGIVHEGVMSDSLGMRGIPAIAEVNAVYKILKIAELEKCSVHLKALTCGDSLDLVSEYRKRGVDVTCDVPLLNLCADDSVLTQHNSMWNVQPPLRDLLEQKRLLNHVDHGTVNAISIRHRPVMNRDKDADFEDAVSGVIGLETALSALNSFTGILGNEKAFLQRASLLWKGSANVLGMTVPSLEVGSAAAFVVWDSASKKIWKRSDFSGKVQNFPWLNKELSGIVLGTFSKGNWFPSEKLESDL